MITEEIEKLSDEWIDATDKPCVHDNSLYMGLSVFAKYTKAMQIGTGHEQIWVGFPDGEEDSYDKITHEDLETLFTHGFYWDTEYDCFYKFI